jgi:2-succinyl-6-hydroxy-2,4-cyclohexadiene-1-carboxylate synthase
MLRYRIQEGPPERTVLLLHGFMGSGADWEDVVPALRRQGRCVSVDLPGHGASRGLPGAYTMPAAAQALGDVLDGLGVDRAALVGYSMGGRLALYFALHHPDRCRRLVVESASPGLRTAEEREARGVLDEALAARLEAGDLAAFVEDWYRQPLFDSLAGHPDLLARLLAARRENDPYELARALRGLGTGVQPSLWDRLETLAIPVLAVAGALDGRYVEVAQRMAVLNPRIHTAIIPNAGHAVHAEHPKTFADVVADFLKRDP